MDTAPSSHLSEERPGLLRFDGVRAALVEVEAGFWSIRRGLEALVGARLANAVLQQAGARSGAALARALGAGEGDLSPAQAVAACIAAYQAAGFGRFTVEEMDWPNGRAVIHAEDTLEAWMMRRHGRRSEGPVCAYTAGALAGFANAPGNGRDVVCIERTCQAQGADLCRFELLPSGEAGDGSSTTYRPDPVLSHQLSVLEILFDRMPMGIAIFDRRARLRRSNPTWADFVERYSPLTADDVQPGVTFYELTPGEELRIAHVFRRVLAGETVTLDAMRLEIGGIVSYWDSVFAPLYENGEVAGVVNVSADATERVMAYQQLEERVAARTRELTTLLEMTHNMTSTLEMEPLLGLILDQLRVVVDYSGATLFLLEGSDLVVLAHRGPIPRDEVLALRFPLDRAGVNRVVIEGQTPLIIEDVRGDGPYAAAFRATAGDRLDTTFGYIRSWMGVPLTIRERTIGMLSIDHSQPNRYTEHHADLALAFANHAAVAIENAQLYEQAKELAAFNERQRLARELHDAVTQTLFSASLIAEVLPRLWEMNPEQGMARLDELRELTRGALAEMRALLLELRPSTLTEVGLGDLLKQLAEAITGRARIPIETRVEGSCNPPPDVKIAFYRIAQEALNNVAKHAGATHALVALRCEEGALQVRVEDDGRGFDPAEVALDSLGLSIMRERAEAIDARLTLESESGRGTRVAVTWTPREEGNES
jgi:signal transduction histidine kinase/predicted hydrocarbon binding protein